MSTAALTLAGEDLVLLLPGALWWPAERALIAADLHLEKGTAMARRGVFLPPYDSRVTLASLAALTTVLKPRCVICLGDSFHDPAGVGRLAGDDVLSLRTITAGRTWLWVAGNHDEDVGTMPCGDMVAEVALGPLVFRHQALPGRDASGEVSGHFHPKASVSVAGHRVSSRCFVADGERLILPAFGAYTGGLDVFDPAIAGLLAPEFTVHLLGRSRVHTLRSARLAGAPRGSTGDRVHNGAPTDVAAPLRHAQNGAGKLRA